MNCLEIPIELWEIIFKNLSCQQILNLSLSCKQFKDIVEHSSEAMNKICLLLNPTNIEEFTLKLSQRQYKNIIVEAFTDSSSLTTYLQDQDNIRSVRFSNCSMTLNDIAQIFDAISSRIETLSFSNVEVQENSKRKPTSKLMINLRKLHMLNCIDNTWLDVLSIISSEILELAICSTCAINDCELKKLEKFLLFQGNLSSLCLVGDCVAKLMKTEKALRVTKFSLECLWLEFDKMCEDNELICVINQHQRLKTLSLSRIEIGDALIDKISRLERLKTLRLSHCLVKSNQNFSRNLKLTELHLSNVKCENEKDSVKFLKCMSCVVELLLTSTDITFAFACTIAYEMKSARSLTMNKCGARPFTFVNLKQLKLNGEDRDIVLKMIQVNRHLLKLEIDQSFQNDIEIRDAISSLKLATIRFS